jgi:hypothetical protein
MSRPRDGNRVSSRGATEGLSGAIEVRSSTVTDQKPVLSASSCLGTFFRRNGIGLG